jgi:hypothetical protein
MKKITVSQILILALSLLVLFGGKVEASSPKPTPTVITMHNTDLRVKALERLFEKHNSPLAPYAKVYVETADKYGVDWRLLPAISGLESSFGVHQLSGSHNSYGWGGGRIYFDSYEDGIETIISSLKKRYYDRGADTVYKIAPIYAESKTWAPRVTSFMNQIDAEYAHLGTHQLELTI